MVAGRHNLTRRALLGASAALPVALLRRPRRLLSWARISNHTRSG